MFSRWDGKETEKQHERKFPIPGHRSPLRRCLLDNLFCSPLQHDYFVVLEYLVALDKKPLYLSSHELRNFSFRTWRGLRGPLLGFVCSRLFGNFQGSPRLNRVFYPSCSGKRLFEPFFLCLTGLLPATVCR